MTSEPWPAFPDELAERLMLDPPGFRAFVVRMLGSLGERDFTPELFEHALTYPWPRPSASFVVRDGAVEPWQPELKAGRHAVLAIGSNAAPERITLKFAHFEDAEDRLVPVQCGRLEDFDVGPAPAVTGYGAMPATFFASPGTRVALAILWVTAAQLTQLTWSELGYWLGRLSATFDGEPLTVYAYLHRLGTFAPDGEPLALAAVAAERRTATAVTQREALDRAAPLLGLDGAEELVAQVFRDASRLDVAALAAHSVAFASERWTPFTWSRAPRSPAGPVIGR